MLPLIFGRLILGGPLPLALTPTLFLVLGPLGQSTTAVNQLADAAAQAIGAPYADALAPSRSSTGPRDGLRPPLAGPRRSLLVRAARDGMGFAMTWWALTFPVGTCVTGAAGLARHTGLTALSWLAAASSSPSSPPGS